MMDCKKALAESGGDMDAAVDLLRTKGLAALAKKAGRATNEGIIGSFVAEDSSTGSIVEVNCETDFVARNADFKAFVAEVAAHVNSAAPADVSELMGQDVEGKGQNFEEFFGETVAKIGENMGVPRFARYELSTDNGIIAAYIHGVGNIGVLVELSTSTAEAAASEAAAGAAKDVAMQIAAASPVAVDRDGVDQALIDHELEIYKAQAADSGKPEEIQEKIALGRMSKYYKEIVLTEQVFVKDSDLTVKTYLDKVGKDAGGEIAVVRFERFVLGETASDEE